MSRQINIVMLFAAMVAVATTSCLSPRVSQNTILPDYSADFEEISSEEYIKAKENISECTQSPQRDIPYYDLQREVYWKLTLNGKRR